MRTKEFRIHSDCYPIPKLHHGNQPTNQPLSHSPNSTYSFKKFSETSILLLCNISSVLVQCSNAVADWLVDDTRGFWKLCKLHGQPMLELTCATGKLFDCRKSSWEVNIDNILFCFCHITPPLAGKSP